MAEVTEEGNAPGSGKKRWWPALKKKPKEFLRINLEPETSLPPATLVTVILVITFTTAAIVLLFVSNMTIFLSYFTKPAYYWVIRIGIIVMILSFILYIFLRDRNYERNLRNIITEKYHAENAAKKRAEELRDLIDIAAHELRHPATIFTGYSQLLLENWGNISEEMLKDALVSIDLSSKRLTRLVVTLLDVSRIEHGKLEVSMEVVYPHSLILRAVEEMRGEGCTQQFVLDVEEDCDPITVDPEGIKDVLTNLLDNAVKYSPDGSSIKIGFRQKNGEEVFTVEDSGPGIPETEWERIFDRFYQVESPMQHSLPGIGLGLYISKQIIDAHNGWINAGLSGDGGSLFSFGIPKAEMVEEEA